MVTAYGASPVSFAGARGLCPRTLGYFFFLCGGFAPTPPKNNDDNRCGCGCSWGVHGAKPPGRPKAETLKLDFRGGGGGAPELRRN
jgi:hypothetical protein